MTQTKLKNFRKQKGFSQEQMAKILSTDTSNYSRKERGEVKIHEEEWEKLSIALDVPLEELKEKKDLGIYNENSTFNDNSGNYNQYYNVPNSIIENLQDYINLLKEKIEFLQQELNVLKSQK